MQLETVLFATKLLLATENDLQLQMNIVGAASAGAASHSKTANVASSFSCELKHKDLGMLTF